MLIYFYDETPPYLFFKQRFDKQSVKEKITETNNSNNNEYKFVIIVYDRIDRNTIDSFELMYFFF